MYKGEWNTELTAWESHRPLVLEILKALPQVADNSHGLRTLQHICVKKLSDTETKGPAHVTHLPFHISYSVAE